MAWFNNGPIQLCELLPEGWRGRTVDCFQGSALKLRTLHRDDIILSKLFAYCDRETDLGDLIKLRVTDEELARSEKWVKHQDASPLWPDHVDEAFQLLKEERDKAYEKEVDDGKDPSDDLA